VLAAEFAANAPVAVQVCKQLIDGSNGAGLAATLESLASGLTASTADGCEGIAAFREKRPPRFVGFGDEA
jgi:enoyl-CoA hydratase/carnithine racemase